MTPLWILLATDDGLSQFSLSHFIALALPELAQSLEDATSQLDHGVVD
jgi:hypothetical protein